MQILCAYKFELLPTGEQARNMRRFAGACRFVFNKALALQNENYRNGGKFIGKFAMKKLFTEWRNSPDTPWLADAPRHPVDEVIARSKTSSPRERISRASSARASAPIASAIPIRSR